LEFGIWKSKNKRIVPTAMTAYTGIAAQYMTQDQKPDTHNAPGLEVE
jgi:hypothetical protein